MQAEHVHASVYVRGCFSACSICYVAQVCRHDHCVGAGSTCDDICSFLTDSSMIASYIYTHTFKQWSDTVAALLSLSVVLLSWAAPAYFLIE